MQIVCGIILSFPRLYPTGGQITHALLSRLPLYHCGRSHDHARLACIKRAASVHPEPGSNSLNENLTSFHYSAVKVLAPTGGAVPSTAGAFNDSTPSLQACQHHHTAILIQSATKPNLRAFSARNHACGTRRADVSPTTPGELPVLYAGARHFCLTVVVQTSERANFGTRPMPEHRVSGILPP